MVAGGIVAADELGTVVGLPGQMAQIDAATAEVVLNARGEHGAGRGAATRGKGPEQQAAAELPRGVLKEGQAMALGRRPVVGNVAEVLGVGGDLLEQPPGGFYGGQVLFALILPAAFLHQPVGAPDALQGTVAHRQIELADEPANSEGGQLLAQLDDLLLDLWRGLAGLAMRRAGVFHQPRGALLLVAPQPFAHRGHGRLK